MRRNLRLNRYRLLHTHKSMTTPTQPTREETVTSPQSEEEVLKEFVEKGAALEHARWAKWQNYLHTFLTWNNDLQAWVLPHEKKAHWQRQIETYYGALSENEKESDRKEVREYLPLIKNLLHTQATHLRAEIRGEIRKRLSDLLSQKDGYVSDEYTAIDALDDILSLPDLSPDL